MTEKIRSEYYCGACEQTFWTDALSSETVDCCPYCTTPYDLCHVQLAEHDAALTPEQEEMAIYERSVEQLGMQAVSELCIHSLSNLVMSLIEFRAAIREKDCTGEDYKEQFIALNNARARVMVSMNQLEVIYGDCADAECDCIEGLREVIEQTEREAAEEQPQPRAVAANEE